MKKYRKPEKCYLVTERDYQKKLKNMTSSNKKNSCLQQIQISQICL